MTLSLENIWRTVGDEVHIAEANLSLERGTLNTLLGPTLSGKTSLMRLMAGLDKPTKGRISFDGIDVTGVRVQDRNVAMVYQQFINYPALTVYENIASPLRIARAPADEIDRKVREAAAMMKLEPMLDRTPLELSGGQQQRTALARAMVKGADLVLLDEPLANLDYKLREELREELPRVFAETGAIFVYATTEPTEALLLGGNTATLHEGRITQFGPTIDIYRNPGDLLTADVFSDPPINTLPVSIKGGVVSHGEKFSAQASGVLSQVRDGDYTLGFRPNHLHIDSGPDMIPFKTKVAVTEITGSESFVHVDFADQRWVSLTHGVQEVEIDSDIEVYLEPSKCFVFDTNGKLVAGPWGTAGGQA
ncbi:ABC transporter ATP-binding protein [Kiloniella litopenaei]|uniref:ABC transporter ATP-binding protein n=1 Tax=Kiloniella litopenaei TaxID=1549748 RepID=A0A0M2RC33_9PROT|nr:ABC transporter ATP-binding protein [Kiloniella litopenaei]KKJ77158.1 ABC transporter ATP-binding protein [Kiloniella litopenaei]